MWYHTLIFWSGNGDGRIQQHTTTAFKNCHFWCCATFYCVVSFWNNPPGTAGFTNKHRKISWLNYQESQEMERMEWMHSNHNSSLSLKFELLSSDFHVVTCVSLKWNMSTANKGITLKTTNRSTLQHFFPAIYHPRRHHFYAWLMVEYWISSFQFFF